MRSGIADPGFANNANDRSFSIPHGPHYGDEITPQCTKMNRRRCSRAVFQNRPGREAETLGSTLFGSRLTSKLGSNPSWASNLLIATAA
jgi:hypothetical protein